MYWKWGDTMTVKLNEISDFMERYINCCDEKNDNTLLWDITETDDFNNIVENIMRDVKHYIFECLQNAIDCNFDVEILPHDYGYNDELIKLLIDHQNDIIEINL